MIKTNELIAEVISLPVDIRTLLVNRLLESLNPARKEMDVLWAKEAEKRVKEIKDGKVKTISGKEVFKGIREKYKS